MMRERMICGPQNCVPSHTPSSGQLLSACSWGEGALRTVESEDHSGVARFTATAYIHSTRDSPTEMLTPSIIRISAIAAAMLFVAAGAARDAVSSDTKPLARCGLQMIAKSAQDEMPDPLSMRRPGLADSVGDYRRAAGGDWELPDNVDRNDPRVRLLLILDNHALLCDLLIYIDGQPFRTIRETWIDEALNPTTEAAPASGSPRGPRNRLLRYVSSGTNNLTREESRWLLTQWTPGPPLLELLPGAINQRAGIAPASFLIDQNADGVFDSKELAAASQELRRADRDEDGWVDIEELTSAAGSQSVPSSELRMIILDSATAAQQLHELSANSADAASSHLAELLTRDEPLNALRNAAADVTAEVRFGDDPAAGLALHGFRDELPVPRDDIHVAENVMTVFLPGMDLELSAVSGDAASVVEGQVSVGSAIDGYPLLRLLDQNGDRQLSDREVEQAESVLADLPAGDDAAGGARRIPTPVRLVIATGPLVHKVLSQPVASAARSQYYSSAMAPDWFASMDQNNDNDLTAEEFLGTDEQFEQLDTDGDGRISTGEAAASKDE